MRDFAARPVRWLFATTTLAALLALTACGGGGSSSSGSSSGGGNGISAPTVSMDLPDSLTGGTGGGGAGPASAGFQTFAKGEVSCDFLGAEEEDPFKNGYLMTKFLVGVVASWQCITDTVISVVANAGFLADGQIHAIDDSPGGEEPTAFSITRDSNTQTTVRLYYNDETSIPGLYISWNTAAGATAGKLILMPQAIQSGDPDDPTNMRMDFTVDGSGRTGDMFVRFGSSPVIDGFRIEVTEDLTSTEPRFTARGLLNVANQFDTDYRTGGPTDTGNPSLAMYTVAGSGGAGAAKALFSNVGWGANFTQWGGTGHFGYYRYDKVDQYFFTSDSDWEWIDKAASSAVYDGGPGGGARTNENPTTEAIVTALGLDSGYFTTAGQCMNVDDSCLPFIQALFDTTDNEGWSGQEPNQGTDPADWRSDIMAAVDEGDMLPTVYPDGASDWDTAWLMTFTP